MRKQEVVARASMDRSAHWLKRGLLFVCFLLPLSAVRGALDPETKQPYHLQVVLRMASNRVFTPVFRDLVQRQLRDSLRAALGDLAQVDVVSGHPLLKEIESKGLQAALDNYTALSDEKIHFVLINFVNGRYELQARQHDGFTGLSSPVVRYDSTSDRQYVARLATLLIDQDFGLAGTVEVNRMDGDKVDVTLKGGALGAPLDRWLKKDQVFAVAQIYQEGTKRHSIRMPDTLLQALEPPSNGVCHCRLLYRKDNPLPRAASVLGYRCLKLGTTQALVRLRVIAEDKLHTPLNGRPVRFSARGFDEITADSTATNPDGLAESRQQYENVAFVRIYEGGTLLARVPVEIVEGLTKTCPVFTNPAAEAKGQLYARRNRWLKHLYEVALVGETLVQDLNAMAAQPSEKRLARAQEGLTALQEEISTLTAERDSLRTEAAGQLPQGTPLISKEDEESLQGLQKRREELGGYIAQLQKNIKEEQDPKRREWNDMIARADLLEQNAEFEKAIALYERVLSEGGNFPQLREQLKTLKQAQGRDSEAHRRARRFIYDVWPKQETAVQMEAHLSEARKAFAACKEAGDILTPRKLLKTCVEHSARLAKEAEGLQPEAREDDRRTAKTIIELTDWLQKFNQEVKQYLAKTNQPAK
jgi:hypothetical protein